MREKGAMVRWKKKKNGQRDELRSHPAHCCVFKKKRQGEPCSSLRAYFWDVLPFLVLLCTI